MEGAVGARRSIVGDSVECVLPVTQRGMQLTNRFVRPQYQWDRWRGIGHLPPSWLRAAASPSGQRPHTPFVNYLGYAALSRLLGSPGNGNHRIANDSCASTLFTAPEHSSARKHGSAGDLWGVERRSTARLLCGGTFCATAGSVTCGATAVACASAAPCRAPRNVCC
jgi:hypothetical protein